MQLFILKYRNLCYALAIGDLKMMLEEKNKLLTERLKAMDVKRLLSSCFADQVLLAHEIGLLPELLSTLGYRPPLKFEPLVKYFQSKLPTEA